jgi:hypothetical protein
MVYFRENSENKISKKQYLLRFFLEICVYKTFVLILTEILCVINSRESGFTRILKTEVALISQGGYPTSMTKVTSGVHLEKCMNIHDIGDHASIW